jgi:hypothetical protein
MFAYISGTELLSAVFTGSECPWSPARLCSPASNLWPEDVIGDARQIPGLSVFHGSLQRAGLMG